MRFLKIIGIGLFLLCVAVCILLFFFQEKLLFYPEVLPQDYKYDMEGDFEEVDVIVADGIHLNCLHLRSAESKGVILFFHGNGGSIRGWAQGAELYLQHGYDVFYVDYRGYGKSGGHICSEQQLIEDGQLVYNHLKRNWDEKKIILSGTSIGSGVAAQIAASNHPGQLILNSPYFSLSSLIREKVFFLPGFLIKYKLDTARHLSNVKCPVTIFHGTEDDLIPLDHASRLKIENLDVDLIILNGYGHNDIFQSKKYAQALRSILE